MIGVTYHLTPRPYFEATNAAEDYVPEAFHDDGFIHCTDGLGNVTETANRYCRQDARPYVLLVIDKSRVAAEVVYEDPGLIYPHIYGRLNRDAIVEVLTMARTNEGTFLAPVP